MVTLGLGLVGIGRPWGHVPGEVPREADAIALLEFAVSLGIRYFDTAPSYGLSEERLGLFLDLLGAVERRAVTVATKFGEHWDAVTAGAVRRSLLRRTAAESGQVDGAAGADRHPATSQDYPAVLASADLERAWEYAVRLGIGKIGPSVADVDSARIAAADARYNCIQLPLQSQIPNFARSSGCRRRAWHVGRSQPSLRDGRDVV